MNRILIVLAFLCFSIQLIAKPVDENTARSTALSYLSGISKSQSFGNSSTLELVYQAKSKQDKTQARTEPNTYFYVFNIQNGTGFVIIAGDDNAKPVLGYSYESNFDPSHIPQNVAKWLEGYRSQVRFIIEHNLEAPDEIKKEWQNLAQTNSASRKNVVDPLISTKWDQSPFYNALCPFDNENSENTVTGCVATAMAQVMKFWNYPANGTGFHSYNHSSYGTLSANFGSTTFDWNSMPLELTGSNDAVATLMYACGVSVDMNYGVASTGGSGAYVISGKSPVTNCSEFALKTYFGYKESLQGVARENFSDIEWSNLLKTELDAGRPVIYAGFGSGGGHCFVNDGYDGSDNFHFNWGWSGQFDGFFAIDALNPGGVGTGGGTGGFNAGHQAVIGIEPPANVQNFDLALYDYLTASSPEIFYGQSFSVNTNIANLGNAAFAGDYCAAIFDNNFNFIDFVETKTGFTLDGGFTYSNNLEFVNSGLLSMLPGNYFISVYYRPTDGNWVELQNNNSYVNQVEISVVNPNTIELFSAMTLTPATDWVQYQPASVNVNIINSGSTTFTGTYSADLYNLNGDWIQNIGTVTESNGLPPGFMYDTPFLNFSNSSIEAEPGTYLLAITHEPTGGSFELTGSTNFVNPVFVTIQESPLLADAYEENDDGAHAYELTLDYDNDVATVNTEGSGCHTGSDYDYYKINLDADYSYIISARVHDSYNSGNGITYTLDALLSYSTDGETLSDAYDDIIPEDIAMTDAGTVYFLVSPYFTGETGSYRLDITVTRSALTAINNPEEADEITLYPNPASGFTMANLKSFNGKVNKVQVLNLQSQEVYSDFPVRKTTNTLEVPLGNLADNLYIVRLFTSRGIINKKILVRK